MSYESYHLSNFPLAGDDIIYHVSGGGRILDP